MIWPPCGGGGPAGDGAAVPRPPPPPPPPPPEPQAAPAGGAPPRPARGIRRPEGMSGIREALTGKTLLLTGVTGFFAKALLAKILGDVPEVRRVYVLIRPGASARDPAASVQPRRRREVLDSSAFAPLRQRFREAFAAQVAGKVVPIPGDLSQDRFGCDVATFQRLAAEVDLIINSAASVSFAESLAEAPELHVFG